MTDKEQELKDSIRDKIVKDIRTKAQRIYLDIESFIDYKQVSPNKPIYLQRIINQTMQLKRYDPTYNQVAYNVMEDFRRIFKHVFWIDMIHEDEEQDTQSLADFLYITDLYDIRESIEKVFDIPQNSLYYMWMDELTKITQSQYNDMIKMHDISLDIVRDIIKEVREYENRTDPDRYNIVQLYLMGYAANRAMCDSAIETGVEGYTKYSIHW